MRKDDKIIILESAKYIWTRGEIEQAKLLFSQGCKPTEVAEIMNEKVLDVGLLFLDLVSAGKLKREDVQHVVSNDDA